MESLTLSPPLEVHTSLRLDTLDPPEGTEVFFQQHPELLERFDGHFIDSFREYWLSFAYKDTGMTPGEDVLELEFKDALAREMGFYAKVYGAVEAMAGSQEGTITALFDVDHTIREEGDDKVRPAFTLVIKDLAEKFGPRLELGLLTAIELHQLDAEHNGPAYLGEARDKINPRFIISSIIQKNIPDVVGNHGIIRTVKEWGDKNAMLLDIARQNPDRLFVYFDNLRSADKVNGMNPRVRGVCVAEEAHEDIIRLAA